MKLTNIAAILLTAALAFSVACSGDDDSKPAAQSTPRANSTAVPGATTFVLEGFADHAGANNSEPSDITRANGTIVACNPSSLFTWVSHTNLQPPQEFYGTWTRNGALVSRFNNTVPPALNGKTFWQVQNQPQPLLPGTYRFDLTVNGKVVTTADFTLACNN